MIKTFRQSKSAGTYLNFFGTEKCRDTCRSLLPNNASLSKACKKSCEAKCNRKSKCPASYVPTRESVCLTAGLNADCTEKLLSNSSSSVLEEKIDLSTSEANTITNNKKYGSIGSTDIIKYVAVGGIVIGSIFVIMKITKK